MINLSPNGGNSMLKQMVRDGAAAMKIDMSAAQAEQFALYHDMLVEANRLMNLTRVPEDLRESVDRNYLDSISPLALSLPSAARAIDVGSGAGFPGIPLAIMLPRTRFTLLDSQGKRVQFLQSVIDALSLNAEAVHSRAEDAARQPVYRESFDLAVARAVAPMNVLCELMLPFVSLGGCMLSMKGPGLDDELITARSAIELLGGGEPQVYSLPVPGRSWNHRAACIPKLVHTPEKYPRAAGKPEKRPL